MSQPTQNNAVADVLRSPAAEMARLAAVLAPLEPPESQLDVPAGSERINEALLPVLDADATAERNERIAEMRGHGMLADKWPPAGYGLPTWTPRYIAVTPRAARYGRDRPSALVFDVVEIDRFNRATIKSTHVSLGEALAFVERRAYGVWRRALDRAESGGPDVTPGAKREGA